MAGIEDDLRKSAIEIDWEEMSRSIDEEAEVEKVSCNRNVAVAAREKGKLKDKVALPSDDVGKTKKRGQRSNTKRKRKALPRDETKTNDHDVKFVTPGEELDSERGGQAAVSKLRPASGEYSTVHINLTRSPYQRPFTHIDFSGPLSLSIHSSSSLYHYPSQLSKSPLLLKIPSSRIPYPPSLNLNRTLTRYPPPPPLGPLLQPLRLPHRLSRPFSLLLYLLPLDQQHQHRPSHTPGPRTQHPRTPPNVLDDRHLFRPIHPPAPNPVLSA